MFILRIYEQGVYTFSGNDIIRMFPASQQFQQPPLAVAGIEPERYPYRSRSEESAGCDTYPLTETDRIQHDEQQERAEQTAGENEQVTARQSLKLGTATYTLIDSIFSHKLQEEGTEDSRCDDKEYARPEPVGGGFTRIGVARRKLGIDLDAPDKPHDGADSVNQPRGGVEIGCYHTRRGDDAPDTVALCECRSGTPRQEANDDYCSFHCRNNI